MTLLELLKVRGSLLKYKSVAGPEVSFDTKYKIARFLFDTDKDAKFYLESVALLEQQYSSRDAICTALGVTTPKRKAASRHWGLIRINAPFAVGVRLASKRLICFSQSTKF